MWYVEKRDLTDNHYKEVLKELLKNLENDKILMNDLKQTGKVTLVIDNKVLKDELKRFFYKKGIYSDYSFNKDLLKIDLYHLGVIFSDEFNRINFSNELKKVLESKKEEFKSLDYYNDIKNMLNKKDTKEILKGLFTKSGKYLLNSAPEKVFPLIFKALLQ